MGVHEWLLQRGYRYEITPELEQWLSVYESESERSANTLCDRLGISRCVRYRACAPAGTISILAGTTSGIEPLFATGIKRRYLEGNTWKYQYVVEPLARYLVQDLGMYPEVMETSQDLSKDIERRLSFQAGVQEYVDMGISSTINLPAWGSEDNNEETLEETVGLVRKYAPMLRGVTFYPDGSRGGQPLTPVSYHEASEHQGQTFTEDLTFLETVSCPSGACGI